MTAPDRFPIVHSGATAARAEEPTTVTLAKAACRKLALGRRGQLPPLARIEAGLCLAEAVDALDFPAGSVVSGFWPIRDEIDPRPLMDALRVRGHPLCLPAIVGGDLVFRRLTRESELVRAGFGTVEPPADAEELVPDCMLVPLAAFDGRGARIGYGRGYYDRAIAAIGTRRGMPPVTVGIAFSVQQVDEVPEEAHDRRLQRVLTEAGFIDITENG